VVADEASDDGAEGEGSADGALRVLADVYDDDDNDADGWDSRRDDYEDDGSDGDENDGSDGDAARRAVARKTVPPPCTVSPPPLARFTLTGSPNGWSVGSASAEETDGVCFFDGSSAALAVGRGGGRGGGQVLGGNFDDSDDGSGDDDEISPWRRGTAHKRKPRRKATAVPTVAAAAARDR
jgi:hypothetical protein